MRRIEPHVLGAADCVGVDGLWRKFTGKAVGKGLGFGAVWTVIGLGFVSQFHFTQSRRGSMVRWGFWVLTPLADRYVSAGLSVPALGLALPVSAGRCNSASACPTPARLDLLADDSVKLAPQHQGRPIN